jgi:hypothetical protein
MSWSNKTQIETAASVAGTELYSSAVTLNPGELAHVEVEANPPATPTDDLLVRVYGTLDDSTENWDDTPVYEFAIDKDTDPNKVSFIISGLYKWRLGFIRDGTTDTIVVDAYYRRDGVSL